jgi:hypothetical protein
MRRFRFRIGTLLVLIIALGIGLAALRESNATWDSGVFTLALAALLVSILLAIHRTESRRAFWIGFAMFGWGYLTMSLVPPIASRLVTTKLLAYIDSKVPRSTPAVVTYFEYNDGSMDLHVVNKLQPNVLYPHVLYLNKESDTFQDMTEIAPNTSTGLRLRGSSGTAENFVRIGHSLFALIAAFVGGRLSGYLYAKNRQPVQGPANPRESTSDDPGG